MRPCEFKKLLRNVRSFPIRWKGDSKLVELSRRAIDILGRWHHFLCVYSLFFNSFNLDRLLWQKALEMTREAFEALPGWKQVKLKKAEGLF